ncbi:uncharacterized protein FOMMEDRAFT_157852 [Fomitiporia mediterranea MF3/22]|uniref:uncharacterized protein n=1 Tax=Fomitiporia mediterranea (strain MF3/22) TaxID=694068 RepID=UPI0004407865|nr:uncharacterized protein FOMMEDRAFT_157852 [Fomitiporia mediterranea MF3/22]EJD00747.1 hypothetical protein FOMMEDRAFT_157852 [Fomitiporia mediterranea MF3/22]
MCQEDSHSKGSRIPTGHDVSPQQVKPSGSNIARDIEKWSVKEILGGEVYYIPNFIDSGLANEWLEELSRLDTWYHPTLKVYGKDVTQSRSIAAYSTNESLVVKYSNHVVTMHHTYPPLLTKIQALVEDLVGETFNHVMLNRYKNGEEYIGKHRDTKENKAIDIIAVQMIVSLSLGAERTFIMTPVKSTLAVQAGVKPQKWKLANGSLVIMAGRTQDAWKHEIPKEPKIKGERISLTFRQLIGSG